MLIIYDMCRPLEAPGASKGHTVSFCHDITGCDLGGGATLKGGSVSFDLAVQEFKNTEIMIYFCESFAAFVLLWKSTDWVEQTHRASIFI